MHRNEPRRDRKPMLVLQKNNYKTDKRPPVCLANIKETSSLFIYARICVPAVQLVHLYRRLSYSFNTVKTPPIFITGQRLITSRYRAGVGMFVKKSSVSLIISGGSSPHPVTTSRFLMFTDCNKRLSRPCLALSSINHPTKFSVQVGSWMEPFGDAVHN